jgi:ATP-binding cassette, subfamily C (CFTR/MRP), member 1
VCTVNACLRRVKRLIVYSHCSDFTWETAGKVDVQEPQSHTMEDGRTGEDTIQTDPGKKSKRRLFSRKNGHKKEEASALPTVAHKQRDSRSVVKETDEKPFELKNLKLRVPKGVFVAIVGRIGCGKVFDLIFGFVTGH